VSEPTAIRARVREASLGEVPAVAAAVESLLVELGGRRPTPEEMEAEVRAAIEDPQVGTMLVAESAGGIVGVLGASFTRAIHVPGPYAVIQDLWVHPDWRSRGVGAELVEAIVVFCRERGIGRIEVGLPRESFDAIKATEAFYLGNEFEHLGPRMRRLLS
jgi:branched-chain amino acid aminotransferase